MQKDLMNRLKRLECSMNDHTTILVHEDTGEIIYRMEMAEGLRVFMALLEADVARQAGRPLTFEEDITNRPVWHALSVCAPLGPDHGALMKCVREEAHKWAADQAARK